MPRKYICCDCKKLFTHPHNFGGLPERCPDCKVTHRLALERKYGDQRRRRQGLEIFNYEPRTKGSDSWKRARAERARWMRNLGLHWEGKEDE